MNINCESFRNCYNCRIFGHIARNCRNWRFVGQGRSIEYRRNRQNQSNLNGDENLIVLDYIPIQIVLQCLVE